MSRKRYSTKLFYKYFAEWIRTYKEGAIREVTLRRYWHVQRILRFMAPNLHLDDLDRRQYQLLLNRYAEHHERKTTLDFHHHLRASLIDAYEDGLIERDPSHRAIIKGTAPRHKKAKFLNLAELQQLLAHLELTDEVSIDWLILLVAKTGLRFGEALGITPEDIDPENRMLNIDKAWDYKDPRGKFQPTKNRSSVRKVIIDQQLMDQLVTLAEGRKADWPIFVPWRGRTHNSTVNNHLERYCKELGIPVISIHGLRHTHASILLYGGVSIPNVAKRLGHSSTITTQKTYIHILKELEARDDEIIMEQLAKL